MLVGLVLLVLGQIVALSGITSRWEGWWIFGRPVTELTTTYWVGVFLLIIGLIIGVSGLIGTFLYFVLKSEDTRK